MFWVGVSMESALQGKEVKINQEAGGRMFMELKDKKD
jgi:hypothetical protein